LIVADSSYLVEGLLKDASLLEREQVIVTPDLALYEVINAILKHESILKDVRDGQPYLDLIFILNSSQVIQFITVNKKIATRAYQLALEKKGTFYDAVFVALALELAVDLKTFDEAQLKML
jgi:predicted nucleic acid-binding protein